MGDEIPPNPVRLRRTRPGAGGEIRDQRSSGRRKGKRSGSRGARETHGQSFRLGRRLHPCELSVEFIQLVANTDRFIMGEACGQDTVNNGDRLRRGIPNHPGLRGHFFDSEPDE
jgi:hypothetical protein